MTVLERVPVDRITTQAREVDFRRLALAVLRLLLAAVLGVLYGLGWLARKAVLALADAGTSVKLGWQDAGQPGGARGPA